MTEKEHAAQGAVTFGQPQVNALLLHLALNRQVGRPAQTQAGTVRGERKRAMLQFIVSTDPDHEQSLRPLLEAHNSYERMRARRYFFVHVLALVSVFVWLGACWPWLLSTEARVLIAEFWGAVLFIIIVTGAEEWKWYRRLVRFVAKRPGTELH